MEQWKPVPDWPYAVSDLGRIKRTAAVPRHRGKPGHIMRPSLGTRGYFTVCLSDRTRRWTVLVHRLVATTFLGPRPEGMVTNHINSDRTDNRAANLEYTTQRGNVRHCMAAGRRAVRERHGKARLTEAKVRAIRAKYERGARQVDLAAEYGVCQVHISSIVRWATWKDA